MNARELARQVTRAGALALPIAALGAALASAAWIAFADGGLAPLVHRAPRVFGPVVAVLLAAAPLGAAQAGDVGALRDGRQIEWLRAAGRSVLGRVVAPRVVAAGLVLAVAALVAAATGLAGAALADTRHGSGVGALAGLALGDVVGGALRTAAAGAVLGAAACATGLATGLPVARVAARGALVGLLVALLLGLALLAEAAA